MISSNYGSVCHSIALQRHDSPTNSVSSLYSTTARSTASVGRMAAPGGLSLKVGIEAVYIDKMTIIITLLFGIQDLVAVYEPSKQSPVNPSRSQQRRTSSSVERRGFSFKSPDDIVADRMRVSFE